jgi:AcrR family transcriptional regulator
MDDCQGVAKGSREGRARHRLRIALAQRSVESGFDQLTVVDLVDCAGVSRATFYRHYTDKFALLIDSVDAGVGQIRHQSALEERRGLHTVRRDVGRLLQHILDNVPLYRSLLVVRRSAWFQSWLCGEFSSTYWLRDGVGTCVAIRDPLMRSAMGWALLGLVSRWLEGGVREPTSDVARCYLGILEATTGPPQLLSRVDDPARHRKSTGRPLNIHGGAY